MPCPQKSNWQFLTRLGETLSNNLREIDHLCRTSSATTLLPNPSSFVLLLTLGVIPRYVLPCRTAGPCSVVRDRSEIDCGVN